MLRSNESNSEVLKIQIPSAISLEENEEEIFAQINYSLKQRVINYFLAPIQTSEREINNLREVQPRNYMSNKINNRKYNALSMIPKFLYNEYRQFNNLYFLAIALV